jgi:hypothetical protein
MTTMAATAPAVGPPARRSRAATLRASPPARRTDLEAVGAAWAAALDAVDTALRAAASSLLEQELRALGGKLAHERAETVRLLEEVAREERVPGRFSQLLASRSA